MSLLTPDSGLLFWMIVSFGIVFVILSKYGFPVIVKAIEQRNVPFTTSMTINTSALIAVKS
jgi:F-type H+-transporting ATPase subunit b